ncbi:MAG: SUMF1/EgtB/PvdO family nonheme iron enzyme [Thermoanaerobaculia bacterium]|nr:SUMF1/EgtB/PvdO family nonheme iron enzyme [Thermoanaerobaculia bacterium]MBP9825158.1 SUMF1/EgtB/PvdO family nonheme iron enzyme [Thermoanaerobaculia bacterium]
MAIGIVLAFAPCPAGAQTVTSIAGSTVTISAGTKQGVAKGMTGKLCVDEMVSGQKMPVCAATFEVVSVAEGSATARITGGETAAVTVGHRVTLEQPLDPAAATAAPAARFAAAPVPSKAATAEELLAAGNRLYDGKDWSGAATRFRELERRFPQHAEAGYAAKLAATCEERAAVVRAETEQAARSAIASAGAAEIVAKARRLLDAGLWAEAKSEAERALALDPASREATVLRAEAESHLGPPKEIQDRRTGIRWKLIPAGAFTIGCTAGDPDCYPDEIPAHAVTISRPYYLAASETTVGQYRRFANSVSGVTPTPPGFSQGEDHPVVKVTWGDAEAFCGWAGGRLPTEAEWEYAARAGRSDGRYPWGNQISHESANYAGTEGRDSWAYTSPVQGFAPNGYGLHDMAGNAWEWVQDGYGSYWSGAATDPTGPSSSSKRVLRGGSWSHQSRWLRVSNRHSYLSGDRNDNIGFRCAKTEIP